jgi:hypothetical protein
LAWWLLTRVLNKNNILKLDIKLYKVYILYKFLLVILIFINSKTIGQTVAGQEVFNFTNLPNCASLTALGGINISSNSNVGLSFNNPSLLKSNYLHNNNFSFTNYFANIKCLSVSTIKNYNSIGTTLSAGINYINYGTINTTNASGNYIGTSKLADYQLQIQACKQYLNNWFYGATIKYLASNYGEYFSNGVAIDVAVSYFDTNKNLLLAMVIKNIGTQLTAFSNTATTTQLPLDVQIGITKKLHNTPCKLSFTMHHLQSFGNKYSNTSFNNSIGDDSQIGFIDNFFSHIIIANEVQLSNKFDATIAYNFKRAAELGIYQNSNIVNGCSLGFSLHLKKLSLQYGTAFFQQNMMHQLSIQL